MTVDEEMLATVIAKDAIRELALLYCRGIDRKDTELVRSLYTEDATDAHGDLYYGTVDEFIGALDQSLPKIRYTGHHVCNHLISITGDEGEGEVYALAYHNVSDGKGGYVEDLIAVRYFDRYRKENGRWRFSKRVVVFDWQTIRPIPTPEGEAPIPAKDPSYAVLSSRLFARGAS
ncbi:MAG: nuclear transport factor 2 family protein [Rhodospirillaceae bacterium]|nr:MAG: nuclear transport factor 2 family protein [Rhodospirillaceae bacterium]